MTALFEGVLLGLAYVMPIGAQNLYVINSSLNNEAAQSFRISSLVILMDISLALACYFGIGLLVHRFPEFALLLQFLGGLYLIKIAISLLTTKVVDSAFSDTNTMDHLRSAFILTWLNPQAIVDGSILLGSFNSKTSSMLFIIGVCFASVIWFYSLTALIQLFHKKINLKTFKIINRTCGAILLYLGGHLDSECIQQNRVIMTFTVRSIGHTHLGQNIDQWLGPDLLHVPKVFVVGGVHGDEKEGIELANGIIQQYIYSNSITLNLAVIPCLNRDGETLNLRSNFNDTDLNRNLPTINWTTDFTNPRYKPGITAGSEPETKAFMHALDEFKPDLILSLHSYTESLILYGCPTDRFNTEVISLSADLNINIVKKMSYDVTGSLNTLSNERKIPTVTIEVPKGIRWTNVKEQYISAVFNFLGKIK